jgi:hypothetical protein
MRRALLILLVMFPAVWNGFSQDKTKLSALVYADYFYDIQRDTGLTNAALPGVKEFNGFQFRRIYLTQDYVLSEEFVSRLRLEADEAALTSDGKIGVFMKDAYLTWKQVFGRNDIMFGIQPTPAFEVSEVSWGYRSLEKTIMDLRGIVSSRDFGISVRGPLNPAGTIYYVIFLANGSEGRPEGDKWKRYYARVGVQPVKGLDLTLYCDYSDRPKRVNPYTARNVTNSVVTGALFAGVTVTELMRLGIEGVVQSTLNGYDTGTQLTTSSRLGLSIFTRWAVSETIELMGRYDYFDPNTYSAVTNDTRGYFIGGVSWTPARNVAIIPNLQVETYETTSLRRYKASVTGRVTVVWSMQ